jgi:hypothetical protein
MCHMTPMSRLDRDPVRQAWAAFTRHDAVVAAPPGLEPRVRQSAAVLLAQRRLAPPSAAVRSRPWWPVALAAALAAAVTASVLFDRTSPPAGAPSPAVLAARAPLPASWVALPAAAATEPAALAPAPTRPERQGTRVTRSVSLAAVTPGADPAGAGDALQVIRVRVDAAALDAFGVEVAGPFPVGLVDVDLVVGDDGWPREVRRIRPVVAAGPPD